MTAGKKTFSALFLTVTGVMAALACISNLIRIPLGESMISVSNAVYKNTVSLLRSRFSRSSLPAITRSSTGISSGAIR